jgi:hypothetical protein
MEIFVLVMVLVVAVMIVNSVSAKKREEENRKALEAQLLEEAKATAAKVTTPAKLDALEERLERAESQLMLGETQARVHKAIVLRTAVAIAEEATVKYQYIPELNISMSRTQVDNAFKVFTLSEYEKNNHKIDSNPVRWVDMTASDEPEEADPELLFIKKLYKIIDADRTADSKIKSINRLVVSMSEDVDVLDIDAFDNDGKACLGEKLQEQGRF